MKISRITRRIRRDRKRDPSRTMRVSRRFENELVRRFTQLKKHIRKVIVDDDGFNISNPLNLNAVGDYKRFDFSRTDEKVSSFMEWLRDQQLSGVLSISKGTPVTRSANTAWTSTYIKSAYEIGVVNAGQEMRSAGIKVSDGYLAQSFNRPMHADRIGLAYTRTFSELHGITEAMDQQISRVLSEGLVNGDGSLEIARAIEDRVDGIGIVRARTLARTESAASAHAATINMYREAGLDDVTIMAEFLTAQDDLVCPECEALDGKVFTLDEAQNLIPVHPNCRCAAAPVVTSTSRGELGDFSALDAA